MVVQSKHTMATTPGASWTYTAKQWVKPSLAECVAEFGAEQGPVLFKGGYWPIEKAREARKSASELARPSLAEFIAQFGSEWGTKYHARGYAQISHARRDHESAFRASAPAKPAADPHVAKVRELEAEAARLQQAVAAKEHIAKLTAERDRLQAEVAKRDRRGSFGIRMSNGGVKVFGGNGAA